MPDERSRLIYDQTKDDFDSANAAFQLFPNWAAYRDAFEEAVRLLEPRASGDFDHVIFPLLFCGRHAIELGLKELTEVLERYVERYGGTIPDDVRTLENNHGLGARWKAIELLIEQSVSLGATSDDSQRHFGRLVGELDKLDRSSMRFRYPTTKGTTKKDPEPHFDPIAGDLPAVVSVAELVDGFEAMFCYLTGAIDYVEDGIDISDAEQE